MTGIYYYKLISPYADDVTKNCKLSINEIDSNFFSLEEYDIKSAEFIRENPMFLLYGSIPPKIILNEVIMISLFGVCSSLLASWISSRGILKMTVVEVMRDE